MSARSGPDPRQMWWVHSVCSRLLMTEDNGWWGRWGKSHPHGFPGGYSMASCLQLLCQVVTLPPLGVLLVTHMYLLD